MCFAHANLHVVFAKRGVADRGSQKLKVVMAEDSGLAAFGVNKERLRELGGKVQVGFGRREN